MSSVKLSEGILVNIMLGEQVEKPTVQILGCKRIPGCEGASDRYRLLVSDGKYMITFAMLAVQLNPVVSSNQLPSNTIISISRYITSAIHTNKTEDRRILVILDLEVLVSGDEIEKLGDPEQLTHEQLAALAKKDTHNKPVSNGNSISAGPRSNLDTSTSDRNNSTASTSTINFNNTIWHPIENINPYNPKWILRARVTNKSGIRTWSNSKGEGKLFSMNVCDETSEIRITCFTTEVDRFYDMIKVDKVYFIAGGQVKPANKQYNNLKNDYEITLTKDSQITECPDTEDLPTMTYNFIPISSLSSQDVSAPIDIIGICKDAGDVVHLVSKAGKALKKREISLIDQSNALISLTLWGQEAEDFDGSMQPVIAIKSARMNDFLGGKSLSTGSASTFRVNPDIPEAHKLRGWYDNQGQHLDGATNLSARTGGGLGENAPLMSLQEAKIKQTESADGRLEFACLATIMLMKSDNCVYKACIVQGCNKKVVPSDSDDGTYHCPKCNKSYESFNYRLLMNMNIADFTGQLWATCFTQDAEKILGKTSQEIGEMIEEHKITATEYIASKNFQQYVFKCRVTMETYNDEAKMRTVIFASEPPTSSVVVKHLISKISALSGVDV